MRALDPNISELIRPELRAAEKLLWVGKPARFPVTLVGLFNLLMLFIWLPIFVAVLYANGVFEEIARSGVPPWLFIAVGIVLGFFVLRDTVFNVLGPSKDLYALTPERGIIVRDFIKKRVTSIPPDVLLNVHRKGGVTVATLDFYPSRTKTATLVADHNLTAFRNIEDAKRVEELIYSTHSKKD